MKELQLTDDKVEAIDWISRLPPCIIHEIMSHLSTKEVFQKSVLSKTWYRLCKSYPVSDFNQTDFLGDELGLSLPDYFLDNKRKCQKFCESMGRFTRFVDNSMRRFCELKLRMQKFRLLISLIDVESCYMVDKWIKLAIENGVKEFDLIVKTGEDTNYTLPPLVLSAGLRNLRIEGCSWMQPFSGYSLQLNCLQKLVLGRVHVSEDMIQMLQCACPLLEDFSLRDCRGLKYFDVSTLAKVKAIWLRVNLDSISVAALTLQFLSLSSYTMPHVVNLEGCKHLKTLILSNSSVDDEKLHNLVSTLPLLEDLALHFCDKIKRVKISSERLRTLDYLWSSALEELDLDTPNLQKFFYMSSRVPLSYSIKAPCQWIVNFAFLHGSGFLEYLKVQQFLGMTNEVMELSLSITEKKELNSAIPLRDSPLPPCKFGSLCLNVGLPASKHAALLEYLFSVCYPKTCSVPVSPIDQVHFYKWFYDELNKRDVNCCSSMDIKCWRHYLKAVKIKSFKREGRGKEPSSLDSLMDAHFTPPFGTIYFNLEWYPHPTNKFS